MILTYPHKILTQKTEEVKEINKEIKNIVKEMKRIMKENSGVGLAANQIGKNLSIFIAEDKGKILTFINPRIIKFIGQEQVMEEGCLSVPNVFGYVKRYPGLVVEYLDLWGKKKRLRTQGLLAQIIQHEIDHLEGKVFLEKAIELYKIEKIKNV